MSVANGLTADDVSARLKCDTSNLAGISDDFAQVRIELDGLKTWTPLIILPQEPVVKPAENERRTMRRVLAALGASLVLILFFA